MIHYVAVRSCSWESDFYLVLLEMETCPSLTVQIFIKEYTICVQIQESPNLGCTYFASSQLRDQFYKKKILNSSLENLVGRNSCKDTQTNSKIVRI